MEKNLFKIYVVSFLLLTDFILFAQPGDNDGGGGLEGGDPVPAPIDTKLIWLCIVAILFAFYSYRRKFQKA